MILGTHLYQPIGRNRGSSQRKNILRVCGPGGALASRAGRFHDRVVKSPGRAQVVRYASGEVRDVPEIWPEMRSGTWLHYEPLVEIVDIEITLHLKLLT